jgi:c-di-GMP-binding flagellar brake protein YcgR
VADDPEIAINKDRASSRETPTGSTARMSRRFEPRHGVETNAVIHLINLAADVSGHILDLSLGGCHIRTDRRFPVGIFRRVEVEFRIEGLPFRLGGVTQAIYDPFNVGIRFLDLSDRKREQLLQLIAEIEKSEA